MSEDGHMDDGHQPQRVDATVQEVARTLGVAILINGGPGTVDAGRVGAFEGFVT